MMDFELTKEQKKHIEERCELLIKKHLSIRMNEYDRNMHGYKQSLDFVNEVYDELTFESDKLKEHGIDIINRIMSNEIDDRVNYIINNNKFIERSFQSIRYDFEEHKKDVLHMVGDSNTATSEKYFCIAVAVMIAVNFFISW